MGDFGFDKLGQFVIRGFAGRRPFASFLFGIDGPLGIPLWVFNLNRGPAIELRLNATPALPHISVDPDRLVQVLGSLVSNALRHKPAGGQISLAAA